MRSLGLLLSLSIGFLGVGSAPSLPAASVDSPHAGPTGPNAAAAVTVVNPVEDRRPNAMVEVDWGRLRETVSIGNAESVQVIEPLTGVPKVSQTVDENDDGSPDKLIFQASFRAGEKRRFMLETTPTPKRADTLAFASHIESRDEVAWENDRIGFRMYGEGISDQLVSSGVDVWLKRVEYPIIEKWYSAGEASYHVDTGEGADFFHVGTSLGCGGTGIVEGDSLLTPGNFVRHKVIERGPLRVIFELSYDPVEYREKKIYETKRITLDAGSQLYRHEVTYTCDGCSDTQVNHAIGLVERGDGIASWEQSSGSSWLSTWAPVPQQSGGHGYLGLGILVKESGNANLRYLDRNTALTIPGTLGETLVHYAGAGWTSTRHFEGVEDWWTYLRDFRRRLDNPLQVTIERLD